MPHSNLRIVSLLPSATEMVCALGCGAQLVGRSHECDYPEEVVSLPACTAVNLDSSAPGPEIDRQVRSLLQKSLSVYRLDLEALARLRPDLILTQAQCEVCAVSLAEVEKALAKAGGIQPRILSLSPARLNDVWEDLKRVAEVLEVPDAGKELLRRLKERCVDVIQKACVVQPRPTVACLEWIEPLMAAGNWVPELVDLAGGKNRFGEPGKHSPPLTWEALEKENPDVLIVMPCGFDIERTRGEMGPLLEQPGWSELRAVKAGRVYLADGQHYFNRPGPRLVESLEILAEILHPKLFNFGHHGTGWQKF